MFRLEKILLMTFLILLLLFCLSCVCGKNLSTSPPPSNLLIIEPPGKIYEYRQIPSPGTTTTPPPPPVTPPPVVRTETLDCCPYTLPVIPLTFQPTSYPGSTGGTCPYEQTNWNGAPFDLLFTGTVNPNQKSYYYVFWDTDENNFPNDQYSAGYLMTDQEAVDNGGMVAQYPHLECDALHSISLYYINCGIEIPIVIDSGPSVVETSIVPAFIRAEINFSWTNVVPFPDVIAVSIVVSDVIIDGPDEITVYHHLSGGFTPSFSSSNNFSFILANNRRGNPGDLQVVKTLAVTYQNCARNFITTINQTINS